MWGEKSSRKGTLQSQLFQSPEALIFPSCGSRHCGRAKSPSLCPVRIPGPRICERQKRAVILYHQLLERSVKRHSGQTVPTIMSWVKYVKTLRRVPETLQPLNIKIVVILTIFLCTSAVLFIFSFSCLSWVSWFLPSTLALLLPASVGFLLPQNWLWSLRWYPFTATPMSIAKQGHEPFWLEVLSLVTMRNNVKQNLK